MWDFVDIVCTLLASVSRLPFFDIQPLPFDPLHFSSFYLISVVRVLRPPKVFLDAGSVRRIIAETSIAPTFLSI